VIVEYGAAALHHAVQRPRNANVEALHPARQGRLRIGLHEQVEVVAQDRELDDAQAEALACIGDALFYRSEAALASQVPLLRRRAT